MTSPTGDLRRKIKLILSQVDPSVAIYRAITSGPTSYPKHPSPRPEIDLASPGSVEVAHEQVVLLKTLYAQSPEKLKTNFLSLLLNQINEQNARIIVHAVLEIGHLGDLKKVVLDGPKKLGFFVRIKVWVAIREKLTMESHRFTSEDLSLLETMRLAETSRMPGPPPRPRGIAGIPRARSV